MKQTLRLFIACPLPPTFTVELGRVATGLRPLLPGARFTRPQGWHITLAFLGDTPAAKTNDLEKIISDVAAGTPAIRCALSSLGSFGPSKNAILWCGLAGAEPLGPLAASLRGRLQGGGISFDGKPLTPHITLARRADLRGATLPPASLTETEGFLDKIVLYESVLKPGGAAYTPLASHPLCGG